MNPETSPAALDFHFAQLIEKLNGRANPVLSRVAELVSRRRAEGHICLPVSEIADLNAHDELRSCPVVGHPGEFKPLILDDRGRIYLQRYWQYENELAANL